MVDALDGRALPLVGELQGAVGLARDGVGGLAVLVLVQRVAGVARHGELVLVDHGGRGGAVVGGKGAEGVRLRRGGAGDGAAGEDAGLGAVGLNLAAEALGARRGAVDRVALVALVRDVLGEEEHLLRRGGVVHGRRVASRHRLTVGLGLVGLVRLLLIINYYLFMLLLLLLSLLLSLVLLLHHYYYYYYYHYYY